MLALQGKGISPIHSDFEKFPDDEEVTENSSPLIMGKVAAVVDQKKSAKSIVDEMIDEAADLLAQRAKMIHKPKL
jgi:hypothetical protein